MSAQIRFEDGSAYERHMGRWSRLAGDAFLDWLTRVPMLLAPGTDGVITCRARANAISGGVPGTARRS